MTERTKPIYCPHCGSKNKADAAFCEFCGKRIDNADASATDKNADNQNNQNQGFPRRRGGPMGMGVGNRWLFLLIPIVMVIAIYFLFSNTSSSTCPSNFACSGEVILNSTYGYIYGSNFTVPTGSTGNILGEFAANETTTWVLGPVTTITNYLNRLRMPPASYIIYNSTTANINYSVPPGSYILAFFGYNFTADMVIFPTE